MVEIKPTLLVLSSSFPRWSDDNDSRFVFNLSNYLADDYNVIILCPHTKGSQQSETMDKCQVYRFRYAPTELETLTYCGGISSRLKEKKWRYLLIPIFLLSQSLAIIKLTRKYPINIIHAHWIIPQGLSLLISKPFIHKSIKTVLTSHGSDLYTLNGKTGFWIKNKIIKNCTAITLVSSAMKNFLKRKFNSSLPSKIYVIPMGTDLRNTFTPGEITSKKAIQRSKESLLYVGRLIDIKGVDRLLRALSLLIKEKPNIQLTIIGNGPEKRKLLALAKNLALQNNVTFIEHLSHTKLVQYYRSATLCVFPFYKKENNVQEGFGLVVIEAMGCGCPVIVGDVAAMQDTVTHNKTGIITDTLKPEKLAAEISKLLDNDTLRNHLSKNAYNNVLNKFDWSCSVIKFKKLFLQL